MVAVKLNAEREGATLARKYRVRGFPTVLYLDADGGEWARMPGFMPAPGFLQLAQAALKEFKEQPLLEAKLRKNPGNGALAVSLVHRFAAQGNTAKAQWAVGLVQKAPQNSQSASAYAALGGMELDRGNAAKAETWFQSALRGASDPNTRALASLGIGFTYINRRDAPKARAALEAVLKVAGAPENLQNKARELLQQIPKN